MIDRRPTRCEKGDSDRKIKGWCLKTYGWWFGMLEPYQRPCLQGGARWLCLMLKVQAPGGSHHVPSGEFGTTENG